jgi:hypothetical protein
MNAPMLLFNDVHAEVHGEIQKRNSSNFHSFTRQNFVVEQDSSCVPHLRQRQGRPVICVPIQTKGTFRLLGFFSVSLDAPFLIIDTSLSLRLIPFDA